MIVVDTSLIYALMDRRDNRHHEAVAWYRRGRPELATSPLVLAEVDYLCVTRLGPQAASAWRRDVAEGVYLLEWWPDAGRSIVEYAGRYDTDVGLTDASLAVVADRLQTDDIATFDLRHFRVLRPVRGSGVFRLLPEDA